MTHSNDGNFEWGGIHLGSLVIISIRLSDNHDFAGSVRAALANAGTMHYHALSILVVALEPFDIFAKHLRKAQTGESRAGGYEPRKNTDLRRPGP